MIIDVHTHIFPPRMIAARGRLAREDAGFAALYADPRAKMATAEQLLASMAEAGVDRSIACGFWWRSAASAGELAGEHAAYLVEAARASGGRIVPFVPLGDDAPIVDGAAGIGEVRLGGDGALDAATERSLARAIEAGLPLLAHCSEPAGHVYAGKTGGFSPGGLWSFLDAHRKARVIAAHWGGGFPFYALMSEARALIDGGRIAFDSAASPLLYEPRVFEVVRNLAGDDAVLWGSDFPLRSQLRDRAAVEAALPDEAVRAAVLGENAARFLRL